MRNDRASLPLIAVFCASLVLAGCGASGTTTSGNSPKATAVPPTATPKPKPTGLPQVTQAFCQSLLTVDQANQIMSPSIPATIIHVTQLPNGGLCDYLSSPSLTSLVVQIHIEIYSGARPIPQQQIETYFEQGLNAPGVTVLSATPVNGVGDQAGIVVGSFTYQGTTNYGAAFYVLYGTVVFDCGALYPSSPSTIQQSQLQQCAQHVVSAL